MKAICSSETSAFPELQGIIVQKTLNIHRCDNLKSTKINAWLKIKY